MKVCLDCHRLVKNGSRCKIHTRAIGKRKYRRRKEMDDGPVYDSTWRKISKAFLANCPPCPCGKEAEVVHHIVERRDGGSDDPSNLQGLCRSCHSRHHALKSGIGRKDL